MILLQGPFESDYSLAIVNRHLAYGLMDLGLDVRLHQRDNTTEYAPRPEFLSEHPRLAPLFVDKCPAVDIHSRYIYPPYTDQMTGEVRAVHCYGWEESVFPASHVKEFNSGLDLITVMSSYVRDVLRQNGVTVPIVVAGLGADHVLAHEAEPVADFKQPVFTFLHVSSCFPRKAVDVLIEAYCREFTSSDAVRLVIKTFPNIHNNVEELVRSARSRYPGHAPIEIWLQSLGPAQMRFLYEHADCLVAPSRGEGFGLPVAEAMLLGCPVVAVAHGGHRDVCPEGGFWPIDFRLIPAATHLTEQRSYWAEPSVDSLAHQMRSVVNATPEELQSRTEKARQHIADNFTWRRTAGRHRDACESALALKRSGRMSAARSKPLNLGFISSWNTRCGIAEYTRYLVSALEKDSRIAIFADKAEQPVRPDEPSVVRTWMQTLEDHVSLPGVEALLREIQEANLDLVSIQYNFGFIPPETFDFLIEGLKKAGTPVFVTLHATAHSNLDKMVRALSAVDLCIVHRESDLDRLMGCGIQNAVIRRQGIVAAATVSHRPGSSEHFVISSFGFFLPPKGIYALLQAFNLARRVNDRLRLKLLNALYPIPESAAYVSSCLQYIQETGLNEYVELWTEFLPQETILEELSHADLIVLPYIHSTESSSAAIRLPLASMRPLLCSDLAIFSEFDGVVHRYEGSDIAALANQLLHLSANPDELNRFEVKQREFIENLSWNAIGREFLDLCHAYATVPRVCQDFEHPASAAGPAESEEPAEPSADMVREA